MNKIPKDINPLNQQTFNSQIIVNKENALKDKRDIQHKKGGKKKSLDFKELNEGKKLFEFKIEKEIKIISKEEFDKKMTPWEKVCKNEPKLANYIRKERKQMIPMEDLSDENMQTQAIGLHRNRMETSEKQRKIRRIERIALKQNKIVKDGKITYKKPPGDVLDDLRKEGKIPDFWDN
ncbi:MAG: hypothetical protein COZ46_02030 [Verrucomicrobia bacterium CG_4_10_14_3_um_filter_43_23]|nr:MAG: hypothetical protein AUJ82_07130 [Verrucomicrobia bacterium CG1_02_43_26]PIP58584.1 MAG: hypothetical protein COX01_08115 [Verrucomicrobia bacterium CG22_combo_CG10-13_8_21_14_all_43_17]PIX58789.1 MAG: hypothetical protein COZ46_02030 [Verrucomicrobia bacterium CG_4_10_14_3_um_filter_43_23]PIY60811.1 MAG: hypothetical protein COY94_08705 [Verrucomicrobia bacterium CG_4_10_14_0_8_um_filter_43_34]PJA43939.1 MAG: hypothetical protein CO175_05430 [Verrucomicrobia bacterium CG_4_9_14_3_um_fi